MKVTLLLLISIAASTCFAQRSELGQAPAAPADSVVIDRLSRHADSQSTPAAAQPCWYDTTNRSVVANSYNSVLIPNSSISMGWTGSFAPPNAGTTSAAYQAAVVGDLNWTRAMSGVPCISGLDPTESAGDQQAAFMMMTNGQLSHSPPSSWVNWTQAGYDAAGKSNLCLGMLSDPGCVKQYMVDSGSNNDEVGHRRWILYPQTTVMGSGDVPSNGNGYPMANALWVIDTSTYGNPRPATRDTFVAWPPKGYVPYEVIPVRWSFSYPGADFSGATVTVQRNGSAVPVSIRPVANGYGENTIVWVLDNQDPSSAPNNIKPAADTPVTVTINNVVINGAAQNFTYQVIIFDPASNVVAPPTADSVSLNSGSGLSGTFTFKYSSAGGFGALTDVLALFNASLGSVSACLVYYDPAANGFYLVDDAGTGTTGPLAPGANSTLQNSQCTLSGVGSSATGSGNTLTTVLNLSFASTFAGAKNIYMLAFATGGVYSGWQTRGTWTVPGANIPPTADSIVPGSGSGSGQTFTVKYSSSSGFANLSGVHVLFSPALNGANACWILYDKASQGFLLVNDPGYGYTGPLAPGANATVQNSQCTLKGVGSSVSGSGNTLTLTLNLAFSGGFAGAKNVYMYAGDSAGQASGWQTRGAWTVTGANSAPTADSVTPNSGGGSSQSFTFKYSSANGSSYINGAHMLFNTTLNGGKACWILYDKASSGFYLVNDPGYGTTGPLAPGANATLHNSQCTLNGIGSSVSGLGNALSITVNLSFATSFVGAQSVFMYASDAASMASGWQTRGTWTVPAN